MKGRYSRPQSAFTLVELTIVIGIMLVLAAVVVSAIGPIRSRANDTKCIAKLRSLGSSMTQYLADHDQRFPVADASNNNWIFEVLTYVGPTLIPYSKSGSAGPFICDSAINQRPGSSPDTAATYGMNMHLSEVAATSISHPSETAILADGAISSYGWFCGIESSSRHPSPVHIAKRAAFVLFADYHVDAVTNIPNGSANRFWTP